jgi:ferredoxin
VSSPTDPYANQVPDTGSMTILPNGAQVAPPTGSMPTSSQTGSMPMAPQTGNVILPATTGIPIAPAPSTSAHRLARPESPAAAAARANAERPQGTTSMPARRQAEPSKPSALRGSNARRPGKLLKVDWPACKAHGLCHELLPEAVGLDEWGFPIVDRESLRGLRLDDAKRAVAACPTLALRLVDAPPSK